MEVKELIPKIEKILSLISNYNNVNPQHSDSCNFLKDKYSAFKEAIINNSPEIKEYLEWNKWFAPRIIFEGINDKEILSVVEELNK